MGSNSAATISITKTHRKFTSWVARHSRVTVDTRKTVYICVPVLYEIYMYYSLMTRVETFRLTQFKSIVGAMCIARQPSVTSGFHFAAFALYIMDLELVRRV